MKNAKQRKTPRYAELLDDAREVIWLLELFDYECADAKPTNYLPYPVKMMRERIRKPLKAIRRIERHYQRMMNLSQKAREIEKRGVKHG